MLKTESRVFSFSELFRQRKKTILLMGVLNVTPDSFSDGGKYFSPDQAIDRALEIESEGADILDIGGESTRPGARPISLKEEEGRVLPVIKFLVPKLSIPISVDTTKPELAEQALAGGAKIINDITGLRDGPRMAELASGYGAGLILMHMQGHPQDMQLFPRYHDVVMEIKTFFSQAASRAEEAGLDREAICLDPGIGFGKTLEHNLEILRRLKEFKSLDRKILVGVSRKSFIGRILDLPPEERLEGTLAASLWAVFQGADILRVHDVLAMERARRVIEAIESE